MRAYAEHGWYLSRKLFTDDEVDELVEATERFYAGERDRRCRSARRAGLLGAVPRRVQRHNDYVHYEHDGPSAILRKPLHLQDGANAYRPYPCQRGSARYNHDALVRRLADGRPDYSDPEFCPVLWRNS